MDQKAGEGDLEEGEQVEPGKPMWTNPIAVRGTVNSLILRGDGTGVFSETFGDGPRQDGIKGVLSRLCRFEGGAIDELTKDAEAMFSCLRPRTDGVTVLRTRSSAGSVFPGDKELLFVAERSRGMEPIAQLAQDRIGYQQLGPTLASWNSLFAFAREDLTGQDAPLNAHPDETLRYRHNLLAIDGVAGFAGRQCVLLRYADGRKRLISLRGRVAALEPEMDAPAFIAIVAQTDGYGLFRISDEGRQFIASVPGLSPSDWQAVSVLWSAASRLVVFRERIPVLKAYLFLSFDRNAFVKEDISGLKNFTTYPSPCATAGASRIDLLRGESQIWIRDGA